MNSPIAIQQQPTFEQMKQMAVAIAKSGLFGVKSEEQALALMLTAQAEGQHPATITQDYDIIQGRAARKTHSVLARFQSAGGHVEWHELTDKVADATFTPPAGAGGSLRMKWTIEQAKNAKLAGKDNWVNYPRAMLRARVIAEAIRAVYPAAIGGFLVAEEASDIEPTAAPAIAQQAEAVTLPIYSDADFNKNFVSYEAAIKSGKHTADGVIAKLSTKYTLTEEQVTRLNEVKVALQEVAFEQVRAKLEEAKALDTLDIAADLIREVKDADQAAELTNIYNELKGKFQS